MPKQSPTNLSSSGGKRNTQQRRTSTQGSQPNQRNRRKTRRASRRRLWFIIGGTVVAIGVVIGLFIFLSMQVSTGSGAYPLTAADPTVVNEVTNVAPSALATVGTGSGTVQSTPTKVSGSPPPLTGSNGKPEVFYEGGEYCPYCAAERWGMIVALSRFGTFHNLSQESSSSTDVDPNTPTFSFYHSSYTSTVIDFVPLEVQGYQNVALEQPTAAEQQIISTYNPGGSFPFIDIANRYTVSGASYDPQILSNLDWQSIASSLSDPQSQIAQAILGTANYLTAAICQATNQQPGSICQAAPIPQVEQALNNPQSTGNTGGTRHVIVPVLAAVGRESFFASLRK